MPNYAQLLKTVQVCQSLSDLQQEILLFIYDSDREEFFILAGKRAIIEVTIHVDTRVEVEISEL
jgi:hypothetical protein